MQNNKTATGGSQNHLSNGVKKSRNDFGSPGRSSAAADIMKPELAISNQEVEIIRCRGREVSLMLQIDELQKELDEVKAYMRARDFEPARLRITIFNLKRRIQLQNDWTGVVEALATDRLAPKTTFIKGQFNGLYLGVYDTAGGICDLSSSNDLPEELSDISELSDIWARRVGGTGFSDLVASAKKVKIAKMQLVASMQTAGIFNLVFQSAFPDILALESPMLDQYRKIIVGSGGRELLRKIDHAATKSLFSNPDVKQHLISENAKRLCPPMLEGLNHTENEIMVLTSLEDHLSQALSIKLELALSAKRLIYFLFKPGAPFDAETMQYDISRGRDTMTNNGKLKICIFPALYSVREEDGEREQEMESSFRVNHQGLLEARVEDLKSLVLVAKARVLL